MGSLQVQRHGFEASLSQDSELVLLTAFICYASFVVQLGFFSCNLNLRSMPRIFRSLFLFKAQYFIFYGTINSRNWFTFFSHVPLCGKKVPVIIAVHFWANVELQNC